jgi:hypothetical protein
MVDTRRQNQVKEEVLRTPIVCEKGDDCEQKWGAALLWVTQNSHWKIRNQSDSLISTEGPFDTSNAAFTIVKTPLGHGRYQIVMDAGCGSSLFVGCDPKVSDLKAAFFKTLDPTAFAAIDRKYTSEGAMIHNGQVAREPAAQ